jgi:cytidine deaminase
MAAPQHPSHHSPEVQELFEAARAVQPRAYAPYSNFHVGAAVRATSGAIYASCNVENAAYPQGVCAEGGALSMMITGGDRRVAEVLVVGDGDLLCTPCGGCRQKLREFADLDVLVHVAGPEGVRRTFTIEELLPAGFGPEHLLDLAVVDPGPGEQDALDADGG